MESEWDWGGGITPHPRDLLPLSKMWAVVFCCIGLKGQEVKDQWGRKSHVCNVPMSPYPIALNPGAHKGLQGWAPCHRWYLSGGALMNGGLGHVSHGLQ